MNKTKIHFLYMGYIWQFTPQLERWEKLTFQLLNKV